MATRVLNTVKENNHLIGFRIITSLKDRRGIHVLSLSEASVYYKTVEKFENVKYVGKGQWEGLECGLNKFPVQNKGGFWVSCEEEYFILGKMYNPSDLTKLVSYKVMNLNGDVDYIAPDAALILGDKKGFINAKIVQKDGTFIISSIRGSFPEYKLKDSKVKGVSSMDSSEKAKRFLKLSQLFGLRQEGKIKDIEIAKEVGATSNSEMSLKIHTYLDEPLTVPDGEILKKLLGIYKSSKNNTVSDKVSTPAVTSTPNSPTVIVSDNPSSNSDILRMRELVKELKLASITYYSNDTEIMSNYEYDTKSDELEKLERKTGVVLPDSILHVVAFDVQSKLKKVKHPSKMLSLDKTKDRVELSNSLGGQPGFLGWKLDGCFTGATKITMADGTYKCIKDVKSGDKVLSYDETNQSLTSETVLNVFKNGYKKNSDWVKIQLGRNLNFDNVVATRNHLFYTPDGWVKSEELKKGSTLYRSSALLSEAQLSFIVGASIGDGCLLNRSKYKDETALSLEFRYSKVKQPMYMDLMTKFETLFSNFLGTTRENTSGYGSEMYTRFLRKLTMLPPELLKPENRYKTGLHLNSETLKYFTALSLAIYYIDDGSKSQCKNDGDSHCKNVRSRVTFSMYRYPLKDIENFSEFLRLKFNLDSNIRLERNLSNNQPGYVLDLSADSTDLFFDIISPYVPKEIRTKKLSKLDKWQNAPEIVWWTSTETYNICPFTVLDVAYLEDGTFASGNTKKKMSYDLEISNTHTYFAKGCLVHNCTTVFTYENGELVSAVTRGDGITGEDITHNAKFFNGLPLKISYKDKLVVRGEAMISYKRFEEINSKITVLDDKYKNPRNLASGSIRQLDSKIAAKRGVHVVAFTVVEGFDNLPNYTDKLEEIRSLGFDVVPYVKVTKDTTVSAIEHFEKLIKSYEYPTDGLVISIDNIDYGEALGTTSKFPRNAKAFKWKDETSDSPMLYIDWSVGRTGAITPVAVFKPVDIEGSTVARASVHNLSIFKSLRLGEGDIVSIYRANMIIPQIAKNKTMSNTFVHPSTCPVCGQPTRIEITKAKKITDSVSNFDVEVLMCDNPSCTAKHIGGLSHFASRDAMNIEGLSEATLERLVNEGIIHDYKDIYHISDYESKIVKLEGFGKASYNKLYKAIEKSRDCELPAFIYSLGVTQLGRSTSKDVCRALDYDLDKLVNSTEASLAGISGVGEKTAKEIVKYFSENKQLVLDLAKELNFKVMPKVNRNSTIAGLVFCITGDVYTFKNRKELQAKIESLGAKASSSVSSKTNYLINNDVTSGSSKNQTAKSLNIPIISEADFLKLIGE